MRRSVVLHAAIDHYESAPIRPESARRARCAAERAQCHARRRTAVSQSTGDERHPCAVAACISGRAARARRPQPRAHSARGRAGGARSRTGVQRVFELCPRALAMLRSIHETATRWAKTLARVPIRSRRPYCARHSCVSWNLMLGKNPLWVARQHGHSVRTMLEVYAAWADGAVTNLTSRLSAGPWALTATERREAGRGYRDGWRGG